MKPQEKLEARRLRFEGMSLKQIARKLAVSPSSVKSWCDDIELTNSQTRALYLRSNFSLADARAAANRRKRELSKERTTQSKIAGRDMIGTLSARDMVVIGAALYWGEGSKRTDHEVSIANMDPVVHVSFVKWLRLIGADINKLTARISIAPGHDVEQATEYWTKNTGLDRSIFRSVTIKQSPTSKQKTRRDVYFGTLTLRLYDTRLRNLILGMLDQMAEEMSRSSIGKDL